MRQFTTPEQTAKLIELGFEKPKSIVGYSPRGHYEYDAETNTKMAVYDDTPCPIYAYSIGELIEMLPPTITSIKGRDNFLLIEHFYYEFRVRYGGRPDLLLITDEELVDALYNMIVKLKENKML